MRARRLSWRPFRYERSRRRGHTCRSFACSQAHWTRPSHECRRSRSRKSAQKCLRDCSHKIRSFKSHSHSARCAMRSAHVGFHLRPSARLLSHALVRSHLQHFRSMCNNTLKATQVDEQTTTTNLTHCLPNSQKQPTKQPIQLSP